MARLGDALISPTVRPQPANAAIEWYRDIVASARACADIAMLPRPVDTRFAQQAVTRRLADREGRFLRLFDEAVVRNRWSPYRRLLEMASCEPEDVAKLVRSEGLDDALRRLIQSGVYVTFEEFKGRCEVIRGSSRAWFRESDFDHPAARRAGCFIEFSSGSGGRPSRVRRPVGMEQESALHYRLILDSMGVSTIDGAQWRANPCVMAYANLALGHRQVGWLSPVAHLPWQLRALTSVFGVVAAMRGRRWPGPHHIPLEDAETACRWVGAALSGSRPLMLTTLVSAAVRLSSAAIGRGMDLSGLYLHVLGEPCTPTRRKMMEASGARVIVDYGTQEIPTIGLGCPRPADADDVHVFTDTYAVVTRQRHEGEGVEPRQALMLTTLSPHAPKVAINVETGDAGQLEQRECGCGLDELGLTTHLREIVSFEKLSSEGMTFAAATLTRIVESDLPARFGGTGMDYQLVEEEQADGRARVVLRIAPGVGAVDGDEARRWLLERLSQGDEMQRRMVDVWRSTGTIVVARESPLSNAGGKVLPFRRLRSRVDHGH